MRPMIRVVTALAFAFVSTLPSARAADADTEFDAFLARWRAAVAANDVDAVVAMPGIRFALIASLALLATACHAPEPPPTDEPPEPLATASTTPSGTELRDAMQAPIQKAEAVEAQVQAAADRTNAAEADAAGNASAP